MELILHQFSLENCSALLSQPHTGKENHGKRSRINPRNFPSLGVRAAGLAVDVLIVEGAGEDRGEGLGREGDSHGIPGWERQGLQLH